MRKNSENKNDKFQEFQKEKKCNFFLLYTEGTKL